MDVIRGIMTRSHLPNINDDNRNVSEHHSQGLIKLPREPVTTVHIFIAGVGRFDQHQSIGRPPQQGRHRSADNSEAVQVHAHRICSEVSPYSENDHTVFSSSQALQLAGDVVQVGPGSLGGAERKTVGSPDDAGVGLDRKSVV